MGTHTYNQLIAVLDHYSGHYKETDAVKVCSSVEVSGGGVCCEQEWQED